MKIYIANKITKNINISSNPFIYLKQYCKLKKYFYATVFTR